MDLEETVKELKSDLKNARELISCLTENLKEIKHGRDEDLHRKLDELLSQKENRKELEKKIDSLREEFVASREEVKFLRDSVETCVANVKDFEKIHEKIQEINGEISAKFENVELKLHGGALETGIIVYGIKNIERKLEHFERNSVGNTENGHNLAVFGEKIDKLEQELKENNDFVSKTLIEMKNTLENEMESLNLELNKMKTEIDEKLVEISKTYWKCRNKECDLILPKKIPLRKDGVSVACPRCETLNIIRKMSEGNKWMTMFCNEWHYQQFPLDKKHGDKGKCHVCGKERLVLDANDRMGIPC